MNTIIFETLPKFPTINGVNSKVLDYLSNNNNIQKHKTSILNYLNKNNKNIDELTLIEWNKIFPNKKLKNEMFKELHKICDLIHNNDHSNKTKNKHNDCDEFLRSDSNDDIKHKSNCVSNLESNGISNDIHEHDDTKNGHNSADKANVNGNDNNNNDKNINNKRKYSTVDNDSDKDNNNSIKEKSRSITPIEVSLNQVQSHYEVEMCSMHKNIKYINWIKILNKEYDMLDEFDTGFNKISEFSMYPWLFWDKDCKLNKYYCESKLFYKSYIPHIGISCINDSLSGLDQYVYPVIRIKNFDTVKIEKNVTEICYYDKTGRSWPISSYLKAFHDNITNNANNEGDNDNEDDDNEDDDNESICALICETNVLFDVIGTFISKPYMNTQYKDINDGSFNININIYWHHIFTNNISSYFNDHDELQIKICYIPGNTQLKHTQKVFNASVRNINTTKFDMKVTLYPDEIRHKTNNNSNHANEPSKKKRKLNNNIDASEDDIDNNNDNNINDNDVEYIYRNYFMLLFNCVGLDTNDDINNIGNNNLYEGENDNDNENTLKSLHRGLIVFYDSANPDNIININNFNHLIKHMILSYRKNLNNLERINLMRKHISDRLKNINNNSNNKEQINELFEDDDMDMNSNPSPST